MSMVSYQEATEMALRRNVRTGPLRAIFPLLREKPCKKRDDIFVGKGRELQIHGGLKKAKLPIGKHGQRNPPSAAEKEV
jgi:hypothetical protein